jgi:hypothetical protein
MRAPSKVKKLGRRCEEATVLFVTQEKSFDLDKPHLPPGGQVHV